MRTPTVPWLVRQGRDEIIPQGDHGFLKRQGMVLLSKVEGERIYEKIFCNFRLADDVACPGG